MLLRLPILLAIALLGLCACKEEGDSLSPPSSSQSSDNASGGSSGTGGGSSSDGSGNGGSTNDGSNSGDGGSGGGADNGTDGSGGNIGNEGAPMTADDELVGVSSVDSTDVTQSLITVVRSNGEIWEFEIPGIPTTQIGSTITYRNIGLVFGAVSGELVFADGSTSQINTSRRLQ